MQSVLLLLLGYCASASLVEAETSLSSEDCDVFATNGDEGSFAELPDEDDFSWYRADCKTAVEGDSCYPHVMWAMSNVKEQPELYGGLTEASSFEEFQEAIRCYHTMCARPCPTSEDAAMKIQAVQRGKSCRMRAELQRRKVFTAEKERLAALAAQRAEEEAEEAQSTVCSGCMYPYKACFRACREWLSIQKFSFVETSGSDDQCHTAVEGEECYDHVKWAMSNVKDHPELYGHLTEASDFEEFQEAIRCYHTVCPKPCPSSRRWESARKIQAVQRGKSCREAVEQKAKALRLLVPAVGQEIASALADYVGPHAAAVKPILEHIEAAGMSSTILHALGNALQCGPQKLVIAEIGRDLVTLGVAQTDVDALERHLLEFSWTDTALVGGKTLALMHALMDAVTHHTSAADLTTALQLVKDIKAFCSPEDLHCGTILLALEEGLAKKLAQAVELAWKESQPLERVKGFVKRHPRAAIGVAAAAGAWVALHHVLRRK